MFVQAVFQKMEEKPTRMVAAFIRCDVSGSQQQEDVFPFFQPAHCLVVEGGGNVRLLFDRFLFGRIDPDVPFVSAVRLFHFHADGQLCGGCDAGITDIR